MRSLRAALVLLALVLGLGVAAPAAPAQADPTVPVVGSLLGPGVCC